MLTISEGNKFIKNSRKHHKDVLTRNYRKGSLCNVSGSNN